MIDAKPPTSIVLPEILPEGFVGYWKADVPEDVYHADKTSVSSTGIRTALVSARAFYRRHVLGYSKPATKAMNFGKACHLAMLEPEKFRERYVIMPDFGDFRSSNNRAIRDAWLFDLPKGAVVLSEEDLQKLLVMIDHVANHPIASNLIKGAVFEASGYFRDPGTGLKVRIRADILREDLSAMPDLKTCKDASRDAFSRQIWDHRYDVQLATYCLGIEQINGRPPRLPCFIAVENTEPHDVAVYPADEGMMSRGFNATRIGLERIANCIKEGRWPGYQEHGAENIGLPAFTDWIED